MQLPGITCSVFVRIVSSLLKKITLKTNKELTKKNFNQEFSSWIELAVLEFNFLRVPSSFNDEMQTICMGKKNNQDFTFCILSWYTIEGLQNLTHNYKVKYN